MAADEYQRLVQGGRTVPETPQANQNQQTIEAQNSVAYENGGQTPATPKAGLTGLIPQVKGGLSTWLVIIVLLLLSFWLWSKSEGNAVSVTATVTETVTGGGE